MVKKVFINESISMIGLLTGLDILFVIETHSVRSARGLILFTFIVKMRILRLRDDKWYIPLIKPQVWN